MVQFALEHTWLAEEKYLANVQVQSARKYLNVNPLHNSYNPLKNYSVKISSHYQKQSEHYVIVQGHVPERKLILSESYPVSLTQQSKNSFQTLKTTLMRLIHSRMMMKDGLRKFLDIRLTRCTEVLGI